MGGPCGTGGPHRSGRTPWEDIVAMEDPMGGPYGRTPQIWEDPMGGPCGAGGPRDIRKTTGGPRVRTPG